MDWSLTYIVGGGPSAAELDTSRLRGGVVLGVNDAAFHKPCHAFFTNDHGYALGIKDAIASYPGERHLSVRVQHQDRFKGWPVTIWTRVFEDTPRRTPGVLASGRHGVPGCSGYVALNLAAQMGAKRIILFGYDFANVYRYFFDPAPFPRKDVPGVRESFATVAPWYARNKVEILNASPGSALNAFDIITHAQAYDKA